MFIVTARIPKRRLISISAGLLCCCIAAIAGAIYNHLILATPTSAEVSGLRRDADRIAYLEGFGWSVTPSPVSVETLLVPEEFDSSYNEYLALQSEQGFDLLPYRGKKITRYTYDITNYPTGETGVQASLLIYKNTIIGGEILSPNANGFLHGLNQPAKTFFDA